jgi:murein DD-endopeptidase MepM/ murein hydrolase activator NlpD
MDGVGTLTGVSACLRLLFAAMITFIFAAWSSSFAAELSAAHPKTEPPLNELSFLWPVNGPLIISCGCPHRASRAKYGINLAVPEGTPIQATEDGVVVYAGDELKTYGNLVLLSHAKNFISAYAHASEILVKRGEVVKRGQVIARSGQTGNVSTPQLRFEIREGSVSVDPVRHLEKRSL